MAIGFNPWMLTAFHLETDDHTQRVNVTIGPSCKYSKGEFPMLSGKNIRTWRPRTQHVYKLNRDFEMIEVITDIAVSLNLATKWKSQEGFQVFLLESFIQRIRNVYLDMVKDAADP
jgi:hypothetical protein